MNKKQKNLLIRVISAGVMMAVLLLLPLDDKPILRFALFMIPYLTVGYDILRKAFKGIMNRQVFDENFLMGVATIGAMALGEYTEGVAVMWFYQIGELFHTLRVWPLCGSTRSVSSSKVTPSERAGRIFPISWISVRITPILKRMGR